MITILLSIIVGLLLFILIGGVYAWGKVSVFLTWNTRYDSVSYEQEIRPPKKKLFAKAQKMTVNGKKVKEMEDLVDFTDLDFETGYKALEKIADGN